MQPRLRKRYLSWWSELWELPSQLAHPWLQDLGRDLVALRGESALKLELLALGYLGTFAVLHSSRGGIQIRNRTCLGSPLANQETGGHHFRSSPHRKEHLILARNLPVSPESSS